MKMHPHHRISVLYFTNARVRAGAEEHILTLLSGLDRSRFKPMLAAHPKLIDLLRSDLPTDIQTIPVVLERPRHLAGAMRFLHILRNWRVDIVHSHMFQASRLASPMAWLAGVPAIIETSHGGEYWRRGWVKGSFMADRIICRFVSCVIAVSAANGEYLKKQKNLPASKVVVIRNGIRLDRFDPEDTGDPALRRSLEIDDDAPIALVLARLEPQKGHRILLEAWRLASVEFPAARLICLGTGQLGEQLRAQAIALGISSSVRFIGFRPNVEKWLALANFTVLPSFYEGLPLAAIESMAAARAVVATSVDGNTEVVRDGECGFLVPPGEAHPLSEAICRLLASPELAARLGRCGRRLAEAEFDEARQVRQTEELYLHTLAARDKTSVNWDLRPQTLTSNSNRLQRTGWL